MWQWQVVVRLILHCVQELLSTSKVYWSSYYLRIFNWLLQYTVYSLPLYLNLLHVVDIHVLLAEGTCHVYSTCSYFDHTSLQINRTDRRGVPSLQ